MNVSLKSKLRQGKIFRPLRYIYYIPRSIKIIQEDKQLIKKCRENVLNKPESIDRFKGIHKGKRCFIVCNGPSLSTTDLDAIKNEYSFASNRIYNMYPYTNWRPTYYCEADPFIAKIIEKKDMETILEDSEAAFLSLRSSDDYPDGTKNNDKAYFYYVKPISPISSVWNETHLPKFSSNLAQFAYSGLTITYEMIQLAVYMGFEELYIIGCDNNYKYTIETGDLCLNKNIKANYPKEMGEPDSRIPMPTYNPKTNLAYQSAKRYCVKNGIKILNATRGGRLDVYERVNLDDLLNK